MRRIRHLALLAVVALSLSLAGTAAAKPGRPNGNATKPAKARIAWSVDRVEQSVAPGETVQVPVTLTSSADLSNVSLGAAGGLGRVLRVEPSTIASLKAGVPTSVTLIITVPAERAHCQAGVVKARSGKRSVPAPLQVRVIVPGAAGCGD